MACCVCVCVCVFRGVCVNLFVHHVPLQTLNIYVSASIMVCANLLCLQICQVISEVSSANQELLRKYKREMNLRKKCHNELVRLKGTTFIPHLSILEYVVPTAIPSS